MAITQNTYTGNGSTVLFSFTFPYLKTTDIKVTLDGTLTTAYTLANATTIQFNTAPGSGVAIRIYRDTDDAALTAQFYPGSAIRSQDLNDNFTQNLYVTQEIANYSVQTDGSRAMEGDLDMGGYKITNLATPTASGDAATKDYVDASSGNGGIPGHTRWRKLASAGQTVFSGTGDYGGVLSYSPVREQVYLNGALQQRNADYSADNGISITFNVALQLNDVVDVVCTNNLVSGTVNDAANINYSGQFIGQNTRTVAAKLADVVSVKDFGAVGDGVTDDTAAIQAAFNSVSGSKGKTIAVKDGAQISVKPSFTATGVAKFEDLTWPQDCNIEYSGPTRESVLHMNNFSTPYQVLPVVTAPWVPSTAYSIGDKRVNGGNAYYCTVAGTSASSGGPSGTGSSIVDGTATWKYITNGLYSSVPVNEQRFSAPYHPGIILDNKTAASYDGVSQPAHSFAASLVAAGGGNPSQYKSIVFAKDGASQWQQISDGATGELTFHHFRPSDQSGRYDRLRFEPETGDISIQRLSASYPLDVSGAMRLSCDRSTDTQMRADNFYRFSGRPSFRLEYKDNSVNNVSTIQLEGATGYQLALNAPDVSGVTAVVALTAGNGSGVVRDVYLDGYYAAWYSGADNVLSLGRSSQRWSVVYAATGTINTSDARAKQQDRSLSDAEKAVAIKAKGLLKSFKFNDAVEAKGDGARIHFGIYAQELADAFTSEGLNPEEYGMFCYDKWDAEYDDDGNEKLAAGDRYGIRYEELLAFIIAAL
jgi:hypothetical protein